MVAGLLALAIVGASVVGFILVDEVKKADDRRAAGGPVLVLHGRLEAALVDAVGRVVGTAGSIGAEVDPPPPSFDSMAARVLAPTTPVLALAVPRNGGVVVGATARAANEPGLATGEDLNRDPALRSVLARARDAGSVQSSGRVDIAGQPYALIAQPLYDPAGTYRTTAQLRAGLTGYVLGLVDLRRTLATAAQGTGLVAALRDDAGHAAVVTGAAGPEPFRPRDVRLAGRTWQLQLTSTTRFGSGARLPWAVLAGGLLLAAAVAVASREILRRGRVMAHAAEARSRELELVAETGPLLQQSLELAELVPAFAVKLSDDFQLDAVAVTLIEGERAVEVFSLGTWIHSGETLTLPLQRSGRKVGDLRVRSRRAFDVSGRAALRTVAELLAAALGNVQLFAREQETVRQLRDLDRMKNDFVSTITHELRTMVTAIAGFADLLDQRWDVLTESQQRDFVGRITRNSASLRQLVDDMLEFSRAERLMLALEPVAVDLGDAVAALVEQMSSLLTDHHVRLALATDVEAVVDPRALERIIANLLSNAAKYAPADTEVTVAVDRNGTMARLAVSDQGPGIPVEERDRVFARFYRGDNTVTRETRGAGVGLAVVRELVERLGGDVAIEDADGGGARIVVLLPVPHPSTDRLQLIDVSQGESDDRSS